LSNVSDHRAKAEHNEKLASQLKGGPFFDWAVTVTFYAAVQYIEAFFAKEKPPFHSLSHQKRDCEVARSPILKPQWKNYRELKNQSGLARYEAHVPFAQTDVDKASVRLNAIKALIIARL
jgi:hypothetical protein